MASEDAEESASPRPAAQSEAAPDSKVTNDQWLAMQDVLSTIYNHKSDDGYETSKLFQRKVNKRLVPDYYDVIKEPMALSTIKSKLAAKGYHQFSDFVRDFALIPHNAQVYNIQESAAYQDALVVKKMLEQSLQKHVDAKTASAEEARLPYLGEIPPQEVVPKSEAGDEDEDDEDDEDDELSDDSTKVKKRGRGRPRKSEVLARRTDSKDEAVRIEELDAKKKRGRPPRVDTPMEARIKNILKSMRRLKDENGNYRIRHFDRLPDRAQMPEYFNQIKTPIAVDTLKRKLKRKKYQHADQFTRDVNIMFDNAKAYNEDDSQIYKDAVILQQESQKLAEEEMNKPDTDFAMEDGRLPLSGGVEYKGETWKVGDWVHIQNPNDLTKPIVTQIFRTWQDSAGTRYVNTCWYYRPEQTVHRFDKHFYPNEVVKTGQYRDHQIDEIVDRCFVMFHTRYNKGRPRSFPADKEIYVCESRYNEEKHTFNKIKTWASCLPDEVRDKDYEMDFYREPKRMKKVPSPIAYLLKDEQRETDELPKPQWGADGAPPKIGAVHRRPRDPKDSPPPEPAPPPPPVASPAAVQQKGNPSIAHPMADAASPNHPTGPASNNQTRPLPVANVTPLNNAQQRSYPPANNPSIGRQASTHRPVNATQPVQATPQNRPIQQNPSSFSAAQNRQPNSAAAYPNANYQAPQPVEVWHLHDAANASIPPDVRSQFHCDDQGRVLFFTAPPLQVKEEEDRVPLGHTARYLAAKKRKEIEKAEKRKRSHEDDEEAEKQSEERRKALEPARRTELKRREDARVQSLADWQQQMQDACRIEYQALYGDDWQKHFQESYERCLNSMKDSDQGS